MSSQLDLDQGGSNRQLVRVSMGPSIGWVDAWQQSLLNVITGGTTTLLLGTNLVLVNFNGAVTIQLPKFKGVLAGPIAVPKQFLVVPVVICDVGGFALSNPITVLPGAGETISGLSTVPIASNYGSLVLRPDPVNGGSTMMQ